MDKNKNKTRQTNIVLQDEMDICWIQVNSQCMDGVFFLFLFFLLSFCLFQGLESWHSSISLAFSLRHVAEHLLVVRGLENVVLAWAVEVAGAGLDKHHLLLHHLAVGALELHGQGGGSVGRAAAAVGAHATELGTVGLGSGAARDLELHGLGDSGRADALLPFPDPLLQVGLAGANHAEAGLFLQAAFAVVVGYTGGDAQAAGLGAGTPLRGLNQAVFPHQGGVRAIGLLLSVSCQNWSNKGLLVGGVAYPLFAALPRHLDPAWHGAVGAGQANIHAAKGHTAHSTI